MGQIWKKCSASGGASGLPKTGQYQSYRTGDDHTYADPAGSYDIGLSRGEGTWDDYWDARFTDNGDNTVTDNVTGLMWIQDHVAMGTIAGVNWASTMSWTDAIDNCEALAYAGKSDWRLPNAYELFSICLFENGAIPYGVDADGIKGSGAPFINERAFPNTKSSNYWSATTYPNGTTYALNVNFNNGNLSNVDGIKTGSRYVRAVRGGQ